MKKYLLMLISGLLFVTILGGCAKTGASSSNEKLNETVAENEEPPKEETNIEKLTSNEKGLFDAIIKMTKDTFYEPSAVRLLEVGDYKQNGQAGSLNLGNSVVVIKLQGENRVGGTLNHYYCVVIKENEWSIGEVDAKDYANSLRITGDAKLALEIDGKVGDYVELDDRYSIEEDASDTFDIGRVNKALKEYWEDMGL